MNKGMRKELSLLAATAAVFAFWRGRPLLGSALATAAAGASLVGRKSPDSFRGQSVVITGGSRGLGHALALELAKEDAMLTLIARDEEELHRAHDIIRRRYPSAAVLLIPGDITIYGTLERAFKLANREFGSIDMVINNAGAITVGPFESMVREDFEAQMALHLYAIIDSVTLSLPYLYESRGRRIVNICSMGGKVAVPHMLPYDTSKFALAGFSQGLAAELGADEISVTTVYPTVMRTGSPIQAVFKGDHAKEFAWFAVTDNLPGVALSAESAAKKIINAARHRITDLTPSFAARARNVAAAVLPETMAWLMSRIANLLPRGQSHEYRTGAESRELFDQTKLLAPLRHLESQAERELNQVPKTDAKFNMGLKQAQ